MKNILFTGGHVTPAIATLEEIQSRYRDWQILFVGRKYALEGSTVISEEYRLITEMGIRFLPIVAGRWKFRTLWKVPLGCFQALMCLCRERPNLVVSFGGYVGFPVALAAWFLGIPVIIHEQTTRPGLTNRIIGRLAKKVCVTFAQTAKEFPQNRVTVTGLPIRKAILAPPKTPAIPIPKGKPILFIVGGSTGSVSINRVVFEALPKLLKEFVVIHQVGRVSKPPTVSDSYKAVEYVSADLYSWAIHNAKIVIGRTGANTTLELAVSGAVAICVPLPWASGNEQYHNARFLEQGGGVILPQKDLTAETLISAIDKVQSNYRTIKSRAELFSAHVPRDGAKHFVNIIAGFL